MRAACFTCKLLTAIANVRCRCMISMCVLECCLLDCI